MYYFRFPEFKKTFLHSIPGSLLESYQKRVAHLILRRSLHLVLVECLFCDSKPYRISHLLLFQLVSPYLQSLPVFPTRERYIYTGSTPKRFKHLQIRLLIQNPVLWSFLILESGISAPVKDNCRI